MPFATPLALLGLLFLPVVIAMYLLKLRRNEAVVPSTLLWHKLVADVEANAPWQRLRRSLLLLVQLLLVVALVFLAARPFLERPAGLARDLVLVIDASASMGATDIAPNRLAAAKSAAIDALRDLPTGGKVSVIAAGRTARIVATGSTDLGRIRQAIGSIEVTASNGDLGDALTLASALAARSGDAEILVATDAALANVPTRRVDAPVRVIQVGRERKNQAIVALAIRTAPSGLTKSAFVSVANLDIESARRRIEVYADGVLLEARNVFMDPQQRADVVIDDITQQNTRRVDVIEVRLVAESGSTGAPDQLASDDRAWAVVPSDELRQILLVSDGDPYLETALSYLPNTELYGRAPKDYDTTTGLEEFELIIFENFLPRVMPDTAVLAIAPPRSGPLGEVAGNLVNPGIGSLNPDEPILRYVDLSTIHIGEAKKLVLPDWARTVIPGPAGAPLLYAGERAGQRAAVLAFEPPKSDLPLQVAFPIMLANLTGELLGGSGAPTEAVVPGSPVTLSIPTGASGVRVTRPDGTSTDLVPGIAGGTAVTYSLTDLLGVYTVAPLASATPSGSPAPSAAATPRPPSSADPSPSRTPIPADPGAPLRFAVDLFDVAESNIAPGSVNALVALGGASSAPEPSGSTAPGASPAPSAAPFGTPAPAVAGPTDRPPARDELWVPILLLVLLFICIEWAVYQRDALIRLWRGVGSRLRGGRTPAGGG
jgi:von Willebrand factor type A domain/Aerotolerance regulator N-terminal